MTSQLLVTANAGRPIKPRSPRARKIESKLIEEAERRGPSAMLRRAPLLGDFAARFLEWVDHARHLAPKSRRYYRVGWNQIRLYAANGNESGSHHH
jgi:hypothetical protein